MGSRESLFPRRFQGQKNKEIGVQQFIYKGKFKGRVQVFNQLGISWGGARGRVCTTVTNEGSKRRRIGHMGQWGLSFRGFLKGCPSRELAKGRIDRELTGTREGIRVD